MTGLAFTKENIRIERGMTGLAFTKENIRIEREAQNETP